MAHLVVVTHEFDQFSIRRKFWKKRESSYLLYGVLKQAERMGHSWEITRGPNRLPGDAALLHVDATIVADDYVALRDHYPTTFNFRTRDISKRAISRLRLLQGDAWDGPVIVKANRNAKGGMEARHNRRAVRKGRPIPHPGVRLTGDYRILDSLRQVTEAEWVDDQLIVERYLPEMDGDDFVIRTWVFLGDKERCTWQVANDPIVKAEKVVRYEPCPVPDALRAERERLGFDFGKFDFVIHGGEPILLDTNRTPGVARAISPLMKAGARNLAEGLDGLLRA